MNASADIQVAPDRSAWTTREIAILRECYSEKGGLKTAELLPNHSYTAVMQKALALKLKAPQTRGPRRSWTSTEQIDELIRIGYASATKRGDVQRIANQVARPVWWVTKRAANLGVSLPRMKDEPWSAEEEALLREHSASTTQALAIRFRKAGFRRSAGAIAQKRRRLELDTEDVENLKLSAVATFMGISTQTVDRWIRNEGLRSTNGGQARRQGEWHYISRKDLRRWIAAHAQLVDLRKVDKFWFIELMAGGA